MAETVLVSLDLAGNQVLGLRIENLASDPSPYGPGHIYENTTTGKVRRYNGSSWVDWSGGDDASTLEGNDSAYHLNRSNHTGSQAAATISDLDAAVDARIALTIDAAPSSLDTLNELAAALGDDPNFAATMTSALAGKAVSYSETIGDAVETAIVVTHNLGTQDIVTSVRDAATNNQVICDVQHTSANTATFTFATAPASNAYRVTCVG